MSEIETGKAKVLKITKVGNKFFKDEVMSLPELPTWPLGNQGSLVIQNGETVQVLSGSVLDYTSIDIQAGGVLEITSEGSLKTTYIGCTGNIIVNGEIRARSYIGGSASINETVQSINENISFNLVQALGGNGGRSVLSGYPIAVPTSAGTNGFGGGGAGASVIMPSAPSSASGFVGGTNNGNGGGFSPNFGFGGVTLGNGENARPANASDWFNAISNNIKGANGGGSGGGSGTAVTSTPPAGPSQVSVVMSTGGGGGGYKGKHGLPIYIYCLGSITGSGLINLSGTNGFNGGQGTSGAPTSKFGPLSGSAVAGGSASGGGGAGGSGGFLWVRHGSGFSVPYSVNFGIGGSTGTDTTDSNSNASGDSQTAGASGSVGGVDIQQI